MPAGDSMKASNINLIFGDTTITNLTILPLVDERENPSPVRPSVQLTHYAMPAVAGRNLKRRQKATRRYRV